MNDGAPPPEVFGSASAAGAAPPADAAPPAEVFTPPPQPSVGGNIVRAWARGFLGVRQSMLGESEKDIRAEQKAQGIERLPRQYDPMSDPSPVLSEIEDYLQGGLGEFIGGMSYPVAGQVKEAGALTRKMAGPVATWGMRTGKEWLQQLEGALGKIPGGGPIRKAVKNLNIRYGDDVYDIASRLTGGTADLSPTGAGRAIEEQIGQRKISMAGEGVDVYGEVDRYMPRDTGVQMNYTISTLQELTKTYPAAAGVVDPLTGRAAAAPVHTSADVAANAFKKWLDDVVRDTAEHGYMPYELVKRLRTQIGGQLSKGVFNELPAAEASRLYGALAADIEVAAARTSPEALAAVRSADTRWKQIKDEQAVLQGIMGKYGGSEKVFQSLMQTGLEKTYGGGASVINQVLAAVDEPTRMHIAASALYRMGRAKAGMAESATEDTFSSTTFLTNWANMSKPARDALFGRLPGNYAQEVTQLAENIAQLRNYTKLLPNPSGTSQAWWASAELNAFIASLVSMGLGGGAALGGHLRTAATIAGTYGVARAASVILTHPDSVRACTDITGQMLATIGKTAASMKAQPGPEEEQPDFSELAQ